MGDWNLDRWIGIAGLTVAVIPQIWPFIRTRIESIRAEDEKIVEQIAANADTETFYRDWRDTYRFRTILSAIIATGGMVMLLSLISVRTENQMTPLGWCYVILVLGFVLYGSIMWNMADRMQTLLHDGLKLKKKKNAA